MQKIILIVEDKEEEIQKAKKALENSSYRAVVASNLHDFQRIFNSLKDKIFGVVTDLHFPAAENLKDRTSDNPNGLSVVAICVSSNVRVVVCSDVNHHFCQYVQEPIKVLSSHQNYEFKSIPFENDHKDWSKAITHLLNL